MMTFLPCQATLFRPTVIPRNSSSDHGEKQSGPGHHGIRAGRDQADVSLGFVVDDSVDCGARGSPHISSPPHLPPPHLFTYVIVLDLILLSL